ncbi:hypothetical protein tpqmel_0592 [Candidatus Gastranaerophilus sp. (ex Termes propinquus)]|nr:hypothetical protein tpqmel_0592 [Candidatus Gastranaerophilus sp. (ex Termes propinquus)]
MLYKIKSRVFNYLTKNQKAVLCAHLRRFVKAWGGLFAGDILEEFFEEQSDLAQSDLAHLHFVIENLENREFVNDVKVFIEAVLRDIKYKKTFREGREVEFFEED